MFGRDPNIVGTASVQSDVGLITKNLEDSLTGAFFAGNSRSHAIEGNLSRSSFALAFSANNSDSIYSGGALQLNAIQCLCCIKF